MRTTLNDFSQITNLTEFFIQIVQPYRKNYTVYRNGGWKTVPYYLSDYKIAQATNGVLSIGYFQNTMPKVLGVDIDDHEGLAWTDEKGADFLWFLCSQVTECLPVPSLLFQSPRGFHCYWILETNIPAAILFPLIERMLKAIENVEVKPTHNRSLRIPEENRAVDPYTGKGLLEIDYKLLIVYDLEDIIGHIADPANMRKSLKERKERLPLFLGDLAIARVEQIYTPFIDGFSNESLNHLAPIYKKVGLSIDEAISRINAKLDVSPLYSLHGELRNPARLKKRIESYYRNQPIANHFTLKSEVLSTKDRQTIDFLVAIHPWAKQRTKPIHKFLKNLFGWLNQHDEIVQNKLHSALFDYLYPYYRKNMREGYYPLPGSVMSKFNDRYNQIVPWLIKIHFLEPSPYPYVPGQGICRYYRVNREYRSAASY